MTLLKTVLDEAETRGPVVLIGGLALAAHGVLRATRDADVLGTAPEFLRKETWASLEKQGVAVTVRRGDVEDPLLGVVRFHREPDPHVDLVVGRERWLDGVLSRRARMTLTGESIPVVSAADLVLLKLDAGGPIDLIDVRLLLAGPDAPAIRRELETRRGDLPRRFEKPLKDLLSENLP